MFREVLDRLFTKDLLDTHTDEWGITDYCKTPTSVGYATTITPSAIQRAVDQNVNVIVTHHDAWEFMYEQRDQVYDLLKSHELTHIWCHIPLDMADFGTAATLLSQLECKLIGKIHGGGGRVGELSKPKSFSDVLMTLNSLLGEKPRSMHDSNRTIERVASVTGAGTFTSYLRDGMSFNVDLYITGETSLYQLEYAQYQGISIVVFSHNYTELPGVQKFAEKIAQSFQLEMQGHLGDSRF